MGEQSVNRRAAAARLYVEVLRLAARLGASATDKRAAMVFTGAPYDGGGLGDDAMTMGLAAMAGPSELERLVFLGEPPLGPCAVDTVDVRFLRPGSAAAWRWLLWNWRRLPAVALVLGADVIDGLYGPHVPTLARKFLAAADDLGADAQVVNFSWRDVVPAWALASMRALPDAVGFQARDARSAERARRDLGVDVAVSPDVALEMTPLRSALSEGVRSWCEEQRKLGRLVMGVSVNTALAPNDLDGLVRGHVRMFAEVAPQRLAVLPLVHDWRNPSTGDAAATSLLAAELGARGLVTGDVARLSAQEIKHAVGGCDLVVSGRMHLLVAALGAGVPVLAIAYADKMEGLLDHFELQDHVVGVDAVLGETEEVRLALRGAIDGVDEDRQRVQANGERIRRTRRIPWLVPVHEGIGG